MESPSHSPFKMPSAPSTPLRQLSAEQINQQRIPQSPSLLSYLNDSAHKSHRPRDSISSVVQEKVAFINSLNNSPTRTSPIRSDMPPPSPSKRDGYSRAMIAYEESQNALANAQAEIQAVKNAKNKQLEMVVGRNDKLMEQLTEANSELNSIRKQYVTEVKKIRKQCFQAEKMQLEVSEELREVKKELRKKEAEIQSEKHKKDDAKQEAFERAYTVAGLAEEMEVLKEKLKIVEQEKDAAVMELRSNAVRWAGRLEKEASSASMRAHEMVRKASQSEENFEDEATPRPNRKQQEETADHVCAQTASTIERPFYSDFVEGKAGQRDFEGDVFTLQDHVTELYKEVAYFRRKLKDSDDTIHLMNMECQFLSCECRRAEKKGKRFIHDYEYEMKMQDEHDAKRRRLEEDEKANALPPMLITVPEARVQEDAVMDEALQVPLPEPMSRKTSSVENTPDATAVLEEMTQVLVEPLAHQDRSHFAFSTSTSSHAQLLAPAPPFTRAESAMAVTSEADLFDMSPPKRHPARPATALGVRSAGLESPIRVVPFSPQPDAFGRSTTPLEEPSHLHSTTTRVAVKEGSPPRSTHRRAQSRPNIRSQSRPRSPLAPFKDNTDFTKSSSASPANSTVFPVTPKSKPLHARAQTHHNIPAVTSSQLVTTTTTVPLRGDENEQQHDFPQTPSSLVRAQTQPIHLPAPFDNGDESEQLLNVPGTPISREAALAQIRARRDRARSVHIKNSSSGLKSAPGSAKRGITLRDGINGNRNVDREVSVASMASAPGRFG